MEMTLWSSLRGHANSRLSSRMVDSPVPALSDPSVDAASHRGDRVPPSDHIARGVGERKGPQHVHPLGRVPLPAEVALAGTPVARPEAVAEDALPQSAESAAGGVWGAGLAVVGLLVRLCLAVWAVRRSGDDGAPPPSGRGPGVGPTDLPAVGGP